MWQEADSTPSPKAGREGLRESNKIHEDGKRSGRARSSGDLIIRDRGDGGRSPSSVAARFASRMASPSNIWVLLGLGIAGILLLTRSRKKQISKDFGAFIKYLELLPPPQPAPPIAPHPLSNLSFAVKDIFDVEGFITGFGNPDWERTHEPAQRTAPAVACLVQAGATCVGKTHMDEMAYGFLGENKHYGTPVNPAATSRVPGGSSSGSAVAVAAGLVDFALGSDTKCSVRAPAAFCGILGFRPSHGAISCIGVVPMAQSIDTVGWFARDPDVLRKVGNVLLQQSYIEQKQPRRLLIADDCFSLSDLQNRQLTVLLNSIEKAYGRQVISRIKLGDYLSSKVPTLVKLESNQVNGKLDPSISCLTSIDRALTALQRYEFKCNHENWIRSIKPTLGPQMSEHVKAALETSSDLIEDIHEVREEARAAMNELLLADGILLMPTVPGVPPKLQSRGSFLENYRNRAFILLGVAGMSGCCQVSIPIGKHNGCPVAISLIAKHGGDRFLLDTVRSLYAVIQKEAEAYGSGTGPTSNAAPRPEAAEAAKEKGNFAFKKKDFKAAIEYYSEAIHCDEKNATYYNNRAAAYLAMCSFHQAEADCTKAIELDKKNVKAYLRRGTAREFLGYYKEADEDFGQALVFEPTNKTAAEGVKRLKKLLYE
ncbi:hypothetical protein L7F22_028276 [Adiantum nelumboides]|nr:hypothetical protein [Adiantum nelumboides]